MYSLRFVPVGPHAATLCSSDSCFGCLPLYKLPVETSRVAKRADLSKLNAYESKAVHGKTRLFLLLNPATLLSRLYFASIGVN